MSILLRGALVMAMLGAGMQAAQAALAYITNYNGNTISIVDTATNTVVSQPDIGGQSTIATAVLPNGNFAYIGMRNSTLVKVLDTTSQEIVATITVGTDPAGIAALPDSSRVYVSNSGSNNVSVIDTATNAVTATIGGVGNGPFGMVASPDGTRIYVVTNSGNTITVISTATNTVLTQVATGSMTNPYGIAISPDGSRVYAVLNTASQVAVLDTTSLTIATTYSATSAPTTAVVSADGTKLYVVDRNFSQIRVLTAATGAAITTIPVGTTPYGIAMTADRARIYVTSLGGNSVTVIDPSNNSVITTISAAGARSTGQFITPELARLTVNAGGGQVTAKTSAGPTLSCGGAAACQRNYATTATVTLTATPPDTNTLFTNWTGDCSGQSAGITVSMAAARNCTANFMSLPSQPLPPPAWFNPGAVPPVFSVPVSPVGAFTLSLSSIFTTTLTTFTATVPDFLKPLFTFVSDALTKTITGILTSLPSLPTQPAALPDTDRATANATPNPIYPTVATIAAPVTVSATDTQGASYSVTLNMNFQAPRQLAAMAALSTTADGQAVGNGASAKPALSHDGGQIVFQSAATNLVTTATPTGTDVLRYRALSGGLDRLSQSAFPAGGPTGGALGAATDPAVSDDGSHAAFTAAGQGLVLGLDTNGARQVYRIGLKYPRVDRDPATPVADLVSGTAAGVAGDGHSDAAALSGDGRYVVFASHAVNLGQGLDGTAQIWRKDMATGSLLLVSATTDGRPMTAASADPAITADGRFVAFSSGAQVYLKDLQNGAVWAVGPGSRPRLSANGEAIVFVAGGAVVAVRGGSTTTLGAGDQPTVSADGRFVAWRTPEGQIQVGDTFRGVSALVSRTAAGVGGNGTSGDPAISGDGRSIAFATNARDLVTGNVAAGQMMLAGNPLVDPAGTRYWYVTTGDQQSLAIERRGDRAYVASLTYDASGNATWYAGFCGFTGLTCSGQLNYVTGGSAATDQRAAATAGASFAIAFAETGTDATLTMNAKALGLRAFPLGGNTAPAVPGLPEAGWWYNTDDPSGATGWFLATATPATGAPVAMLTGTVYDRTGQPFWAVAQGTIAGSTSFSFSGTLNRYAGGAPLGQAATQAPSGNPVGPIAVTWTGSRTATAVLPNGQRANLARWPF